MVIGFPLADAEKALLAWHDGVDIQRAPEPSDGVDIAAVIARTQSEVQWVCTTSGFDDVADPAYPLITLGLGTIVPDVVGEPLARARELVQAQGLVPVDAAEADAGRTVEAQDPRAGETVDLGTTVTLRTPVGDAGATRAPRVAVPSIVGLTPEAAREAVEGAGLVFRGVREGDGPEVGRVIAQDPPPRTLVRRGIEVTATIEMVAVPLGSLTSDDAPAPAWLPILVAVAVGVGLAVLVSALLRARYRRRWNRGQIAFEARPDVGRVMLAEDPDGGRSFAFGVRSRVGASWSELEEEDEVLT